MSRASSSKAKGRRGARKGERRAARWPELTIRIALRLPASSHQVAKGQALALGIPLGQHCTEILVTALGAADQTNVPDQATASTNL